ncbi:MAG TPA: malto-oligosyltrehalose synthase [Alphaproteobacteria bacterium]|nr:malto-oligosyltrehalose synthase [Alphaproteobacteria bacterium]
MTDIPRATYRLQLHKDFTFDDAAAIVPYLAQLGISHLYASPITTARPGSTHGYDITDHNRLNPELGGEEAFARLAAALKAHGLGLLVDFVPNHMGIGPDNPWWRDVLEWGRASPYAEYFDINWDPADSAMAGKVLLPILGDHYGRVLERGELKLDFERGRFVLRYWETTLPVRLRDYVGLLREASDGRPELAALLRQLADMPTAKAAPRALEEARARADLAKSGLDAMVAADEGLRAAIDAVLARTNGEPGQATSFQRLHQLLEAQNYRLAFWRVAGDEINYRRFFDINELAGLRIEHAPLFAEAHGLMLRLIGEGTISGLRLDHIDGLFDPRGYCRQLQAESGRVMGAGEGADRPLYLLVEKILANHEKLREDWPLHGTTGYEYMNLVGGLFVDPKAEKRLSVTYARVAGAPLDFERIAHDAKVQIITRNLASELNVLVDLLHGIARQSWFSRDFTASGLRAALVDVVAHFPVYRTYVTAEGVAEEDRRFLDWAFARARRGGRVADTSVYDFLYGVLSTDFAREEGNFYRNADVLLVAQKFQQFTGPVMAKSIEDTAFYRFYRLISLNEVGGEPTRFGVSPEAFHHLNRDRLKRWPHSMLASATHDHKRGEDVRARISALSELPSEWHRRVRRWVRLNAARKTALDEANSAPDGNDEYLIYQTLVGSWPFDPAEAASDAYRDRLVGFLRKAMREAKVHSSWTQPNEAYEQAAERFLCAILDPAKAAAFHADFAELQARTALIGAVNGLSATLLKLTSPGVPDTYQGTEFWDLSLVDPDNRRPVDYAARHGALGPAAKARPEDLLAHWRDGRIKQHVVAAALDLRRRLPALFAEGRYEAVETTGEHAGRLIAFQRRHDGQTVTVVAPRLVAPLLAGAEQPLVPPAAWGDTALVLPDADSGALMDVMTGATHPANRTYAAADILAAFPVACLVSQG